MERLCDEVIQLIFYELNDPTALALASKNLLRVSQDPYVRAHYFLTRYGNIHAMFWALGRGKILTEAVIDILISSGAFVSRYLIQVAIHHYFRSASHFVKTTWVRSVPLSVFTHFMKVTSALYDDIPLAKGDDDGSVFSAFLKESRLPPELKTTKWEEVRDILEKYKFIPFCIKDPIMVQFPLALAIEPRLLPFAEANGFHMDTKYRDFVFRKMFEKLALHSNDRTEDIVRNVRELRRLDTRMFLSRTVAAEICMEAKSNESAYGALKALDRAGELLFELPHLVEDLTKLFVKTRSITANHTINVLRQLQADFPSSDPTVRVVMLLTVFLSDPVQIHNSVGHIKTKLEPLGLLPLTRKDLVDVTINPFFERHSPIMKFAKDELKMSSKEIKELVQEVALKCLEIGCKGKTIRQLVESYPFLHSYLADHAVQRYNISLDDLPPYEDEEACAGFEAKLCRDFNSAKSSFDISASVPLSPSHEDGAVDAPVDGDVDTPIDAEDGEEEEMVEEEHVERQLQSTDALDLGTIGQDTLTAMIRQDELSPARALRRSLYYSYYSNDSSGKLQYPSDALQVGKWMKEHYDPRSHMLAIFITHAIINNNVNILHSYFNPPGMSYVGDHVPVTLKHFKLLAHLGRAPSSYLYHEVELGAEFYFSEQDYITQQPSSPDSKRSAKVKWRMSVKKETSPPTIPNLGEPRAGPSRTTSSRSPRKRPRRSVTSTLSYVVPDSDDEDIVESDNDLSALMNLEARKRKAESNLQRWIKHLAIILSEELRKYKEKRKRLEKSAPLDVKLRVAKTEFHKSLTSNLRQLRKTDLDKRKQLYGPDAGEEDYSEDDDDEYQSRTARVSKRRRTMT
ncbi:hypothetical protein BJ138DRAFT_1081602 [Hygrophoropsis aurantiaca]|uniref:Uncharacterized protein n=1 Tax=Hygrophoropsis aurantiaca TaxID=72124 RepID=A0ACB8AKE6_9AGAM|nr:hypothetical protein BJ138DRAFT_1081602 [Hygrophoropsis aurantiaca]